MSLALLLLLTHAGAAPPHRDDPYANASFGEAFSYLDERVFRKHDDLPRGGDPARKRSRYVGWKRAVGGGSDIQLSAYDLHAGPKGIGGVENYRATFKLSDLDPTRVKVGGDGDTVVVSCRGTERKIAVRSHPAGDRSHETEDHVSSWTFSVIPEADGRKETERIASAFARVIRLCGGKPTPQNPSGDDR